LSVRASRLSIRTSRLSVRTSRLSVRARRLGCWSSRLSIRASRLSIRASRLSVRASRLSVRASRLSVRTSRLSVRTSRLGCWSSRLSVWTSRLGCWSSRLSVWTGRLSVRTSRLGCWSSRLKSWNWSWNWSWGFRLYHGLRLFTLGVHWLASFVSIVNLLLRLVKRHLFTSINHSSLRTLFTLFSRLPENFFNSKLYGSGIRILLLVVHNGLNRLRLNTLLHGFLRVELFPRIAQETNELLVCIIDKLIKRCYFTIHKVIEIVYNLRLSPHTTCCAES